MLLLSPATTSGLPSSRATRGVCAIRGSPRDPLRKCTHACGHTHPCARVSMHTLKERVPAQSGGCVKPAGTLGPRCAHLPSHTGGTCPHSTHKHAPSPAQTQRCLNVSLAFASTEPQMRFSSKHNGCLAPPTLSSGSPKQWSALVVGPPHPLFSLHPSHALCPATSVVSGSFATPRTV